MQQALDRYLRVGRAVALTRRLPFLWRFDYQVREVMRRVGRPPFRLARSAGGRPG
jgi:hypothetical protein